MLQRRQQGDRTFPPQVTNQRGEGQDGAGGLQAHDAGPGRNLPSSGPPGTATTRSTADRAPKRGGELQHHPLRPAVVERGKKQRQPLV